MPVPLSPLSHQLARFLYSLAVLLLLPLAPLYLVWRARRQPDYLRHWSERFGLFFPKALGKPTLWVHAVSVGETRAAAPLIRALLEQYPDHALLLTHTTPTGREAGAQLFGDRVIQAYLPYDLRWFVQRFLAQTQPVAGVIMETEVWPNLYAACASRGIPLFLVNARLSERSARGYARVAALARPALESLAGVAAQTEADAERLRALGARQVVVTGNLKFDATPSPNTTALAAELKQWFGSRFVFLAASTREGEEALILDTLEQCHCPDLLLVIVPRHPQRFGEVAGLIREHGLKHVRRSEKRPVPETTRVFLGDSMGEMAVYYAACDIAFVGGSLMPHGGQNLIEAAAAGRPVLIGPHTWNFEAAAGKAIEVGAARRVQDAAELAEAVRVLYGDAELRRRMGEAGRAFAEAHRGATARVMAMLEPALARKS